ncbi:hypothetical protein, partial [Roseibium sp.]|uniref:hypothetical protein n=1 Tax=Roseibium sp. TaxID=1936156 RepID=UPI0032992456
MTDADPPEVSEPVVLKGGKAVEKWKEGKGVWNDWVTKNPVAKIEFSDVDFGSSSEPYSSQSFRGFLFGRSGVSFNAVTSKIGDVSFDGAEFGGGDVSFDGANFVKSGVSFEEAVFGDCAVSFDNVECSKITFSPKVIGSGSITACGMKVDGPAIFRLPPSAKSLKQFDLSGSSFNGPLTLEGDLTTPPDLRSVKAAHHVELGKLSVELKRDSIFPFWPLSVLSRLASDREDAAKLRRLKEIAEANRDHHAALRFSADENRARRWRETPRLASVLDMIFSGTSNYGQSILRPFVWLCLLGVIAAMFYRCAACPAYADCWQAARLSLSNSLPFLPQSRTLRLDASEALYGETTSLWVDIVMVVQGTLS